MKKMIRESLTASSYQDRAFNKLLHLPFIQLLKSFQRLSPTRIVKSIMNQPTKTNLRTQSAAINKLPASVIFANKQANLSAN